MRHGLVVANPYCPFMLPLLLPKLGLYDNNDAVVFLVYPFFSVSLHFYF